MTKLDCNQRSKIVKKALMAASRNTRRTKSADEYSREIKRFSVLLEHFMGRDDSSSPGVKINEQTILESIKASPSIPEVRELLEHIAEESPYESVRNAAKRHGFSSEEG